MGPLKLDPQRYVNSHGHFELPLKYEHLSGAGHDAIIAALCDFIEQLEARVEELEQWLPVPPDEEDF